MPVSLACLHLSVTFSFLPVQLDSLNVQRRYARGAEADCHNSTAHLAGETLQPQQVHSLWKLLDILTLTLPSWNPVLQRQGPFNNAQPSVPHNTGKHDKPSHTASAVNIFLHRISTTLHTQKAASKGLQSNDNTHWASCHYTMFYGVILFITEKGK